ncbi:MAG: AMP-binding protein [Ardenticatenales bacterium]|nr:AMP-binding protein [Ardenticatenales bacterium]
MAPLLSPLAAPTLLDLARWRVERHPQQRLYTFLEDGESKERHMTYAQLDEQARVVAAWLQRLGLAGKCALLLYPPQLEYITAWFGCVYAGVVAVPAYPPQSPRLLPRLQAIIADAQIEVILTTSPVKMLADLWIGQNPEWQRIPWLTTDNLPADLAAADWQEPSISGDTLAFLQYTSGSTAAPKGVMLNHANLLHNLAHIYRCFDQNEESVGVIWLPPYHDMGLIGGILEPFYGGFPVVLMSPLDFLRRPFRWVQAISRYQATTSGGPNFAYDLCARKVTPEQVDSLDLSCWRVAFNGAEPVRAETHHRFAEKFAAAGFRSRAFYPCYGLAEATLIVSGGDAASPPVTHSIDLPALRQRRAIPISSKDADHAYLLVGNGQTLTDQQIVIANPHTRQRCLPEEVGEIWVSGPSVAQGYWHQPEKTTETFRAFLADTGEGPFLRTGDLGFLYAGELFVTGRLKDLIIVRGRNHYPQDIESSVEDSHPALRPGCSAAFAVDHDGDEQVVVVQEVNHQESMDLAALARIIRQAVAVKHELQLHAVVLLEPRTIPKTSSGKVQRHLCRQKFLDHKLKHLYLDVLETTAIQDGASGAPTGHSNIRAVLLSAATPADQSALLTTYLREQASNLLHLPTAALTPDAPLNALGIDSLTSVAFKNVLETDLGVTLSLTRFLEGATLTDLAQEIQQHRAGDVAAALLTPPPLSPAPRVQTMPLSFSQQRLWFMDRLEPGNPAYNIPVAVALRGRIQVESLRRSLEAIVTRHESLRTTFPTIQGEPAQVIGPPEPFTLPVREVPATMAVDPVYELAQAEAQKPFDITRDCLLRAQLLRRAADDHVLLLTMHHIAADGWSMGIFLRELVALYTAYCRDASPTLPPLPLQYADYAYWQRRWLQDDVLAALVAYWREQLAGVPPLLALPTDKPRPSTPTFRGRIHTTLIPQETLRQIRSLERQTGATLYMVLLAALQLLLHHFAEVDDVVVGTDVANRHWHKTADVIGLFVNQLVLRTDLSGNPTFAELVQRVRETALGAYKHQDMPFDKLVEILKPERNAGYNPLFQVMFVLENAPMPALALPDLQLNVIEVDGGTAPFDISLLLTHEENHLKATWRYKVDLFQRNTIQQLADMYLLICTSAAGNPHITLDEIRRQLRQYQRRRQRETAGLLKDAQRARFSQLARRRPDGQD